MNERRFPFIWISTASGSERLSAKAPLAIARGTDWSPQSMLKNFVNRVINTALTKFFWHLFKSEHVRLVQYRAHVCQDKGEECGLNPPNGSWGIVKVQPTQTDNLFLNPPNGSWGIVKVQPSP